MINNFCETAGEIYALAKNVKDDPASTPEMRVAASRVVNNFNLVTASIAAGCIGRNMRP
ncbi:hypothetical protein [Agrobacterium tumefaciens]|uniref:hypothetical protein n=1 Tax=Agrobacterium tumefaciens TaxID=358 RepID=UPI0013017876